MSETKRTMPGLLDLSRQTMAFYQTYVAEQAKSGPTSFLQTMMFGEPAWGMLSTIRSCATPAREQSLLAGLPAAVATSEMQEPVQAWRTLRDAGFCGLTAPDGTEPGLPIRSVMRIISALGRRSLSAALAAVSSTACARVLDRHAAPDLASRWLPALGSRRIAAAYALTEPEVGSDAEMVATRAEIKGSEYVLTGVKSLVAGGAAADLLLVFATGCGDDEAARSRLTAFVVPVSKSGISRREITAPTGLETCGFAEVSLESVRVSREAMVGAAGEGSRIVSDLMGFVRLGVAAALSGAASASLEEVALVAVSRRQFGRSLAAFEMVQDRLARMDAGAFAMAASVDLAAALVDAHPDATSEAVAARLFCADMAGPVLDHAATISGGCATTADHPISRRRAALQALRFAGGADDVQRIYLALHGGRSAMQFVLDVGAARRGASWLDSTVRSWRRRFQLSFRRPVPRGLDRRLAFSVRNLGECSGALAERLHQVFDYYDAQVAEREFPLQHQFELRRCADMAVQSFALLACILRTDLICRSEIEGDATAAVLASDYLAQRAWRDVARWAAEIYLSDDEEVKKLAALAAGDEATAAAPDEGK